MAATPAERYQMLMAHQRAQVDAVACLLGGLGHYHGDDGQRLADALAVVDAARFAPPLGDNHHNAAACPYCSG